MDLDLGVCQATRRDDALPLVFLGPGWYRSLLSHLRGPRESAGSICPWGTPVSHQMERPIQKSGLVVSAVLCQPHRAWVPPWGDSLGVARKLEVLPPLCVCCRSGWGRGKPSSLEGPGQDPSRGGSAAASCTYLPRSLLRRQLWMMLRLAQWDRSCSHAANLTNERERIEQKSGREKCAQRGCRAGTGPLGRLVHRYRGGQTRHPRSTRLRVLGVQSARIAVSLLGGHT